MPVKPREKILRINHIARAAKHSLTSIYEAQKFQGVKFFCQFERKNHNVIEITILIKILITIEMVIVKLKMWYNSYV